MTKAKHQTKPTIQEVKCFRCPCGKIWNHQERAAECCGNKLCTQCNDRQWKYSYKMICERCKETNAQEYWHKSEKKEWGKSPFVYSDYLNEYLTEDDIYWKFEDDFNRQMQDKDWPKAAEHYRLYVCTPHKPPQISLLDSWCDYMPTEVDFEPPKGWEEIETAYNEYIENCTAFSYIDTSYGLRV